MTTKPEGWRACQVEHWHEEYEGTFCRCPGCEAILSIQQAFRDGCADCGAKFDLAWSEGDR